VVHHAPELHVVAGGCRLGQHRVHLGQVDALLRGLAPSLVRDDRGDDGHLLSGHPTVGERGSDLRQMLERASVPHDLPRCGGREPAMRPQPRAHRLQPVVLRGLGEVGHAHPTGQLGVDPVAGPDQHRRPTQLISVAHHVEVVGGQGIQRRFQLAHDTSCTFDQLFEEDHRALT
jgi:hypothetical protein